MDDPIAERPMRRTNFVSERGWSAFDQFKAGISGRKGERAVADELRARGIPALHDVILVDEQGTTQIDHIVCGPDAILVIETKHYAGAISGKPDGPAWIQDIADGTARHTFQNPLRQNYRHVQAVKAVLLGHAVTVAGAVVCTGTATFSADLAGSVTPIAQIDTLLRARSPSTAAPPSVSAWSRLQAAAKAGEARRAQHEQRLKDRKDGRRA
jgi:restriction system protein